jgi:hypothetical protein
MMGMGFSRLLVAAALVAASVPSAWAQNGKNYDTKTMNFDLWCQETAHLPVDRCDKRTPEDEKTFEAFRDKVERYEIPYLQQQRNDVLLNRNILHNDPVDNPVTQDPERQTQSPNATPKTPSP